MVMLPLWRACCWLGWVMMLLLLAKEEEEEEAAMGDPSERGDVCTASTIHPPAQPTGPAQAAAPPHAVSQQAS